MLTVLGTEKPLAKRTFAKNFQPFTDYSQVVKVNVPLFLALCAIFWRSFIHQRFTQILCYQKQKPNLTLRQSYVARPNVLQSHQQVPENLARHHPPRIYAKHTAMF